MTQTFGIFHQNLVMEYNHEMAVADGVTISPGAKLGALQRAAQRRAPGMVRVQVNYDVYRIRTRISEAGYYGEADCRRPPWMAEGRAMQEQLPGRTNVARGGTPGATGYSVQIQERDTRKKRWEQLDDDFSHDPNQLDRDVVGLGEPEKEEGPVNLLPGERVGHGWPTLDSQAEQDCGAQREIRDAHGCANVAGGRMPGATTIDRRVGIELGANT